ncbi:MAG: hypothetical protein ABL866_08850 [Devosia sp.]
MLTTLSILSFDQGPRFELRLKNDIPQHLFEPPARLKRDAVPARKPER